MTLRQAKWFAKVRQGLEEDTGKTLEQWILIAKECPESSHKNRLAWFKEVHGLGVNRASTILGAAFESGLGWDQPEVLLERLWKTPESRAIYDAIESVARSLGDDVVVGPRKTFSGFSRNFQFAAARPVKGRVRLGLALEPSTIEPVIFGSVKLDLDSSIKSDSWSDRLKSVVVVASAAEINDEVRLLLKSAWELS